MLDIDELMPVVPEEADGGAFRMDADAVAVGVLGRGCDGRTHRDLGEMGQPPEGLLNLRGFYGKLALVADVLVGAAAAGAKVGTGGLHAVRRGLVDGDQLRLGVSFLSLGQAGGNLLAGNDERDEDGEALITPYPFATKGNVVDRESHGIFDFRIPIFDRINRGFRARIMTNR